MTVNTLLKDSEMEELGAYLKPYYESGLDAVIVQDMGVLSYIRENFPDLDIHASTQMTVLGAEGAEFLKKQGVARVVTARSCRCRRFAGFMIPWMWRLRALFTEPSVTVIRASA